jgi:hypothetical protein
MAVKAVLFKAAMFDIQNFPHANRMLILPNGCPNYMEVPRPHIRLNVCLGQLLCFLRQHELGFIHSIRQSALDLEQAALGRVHEPSADHNWLLQAHFFCQMKRCSFRQARLLRHKQRHADDAVSRPFHLRPHQASGLFREWRLQALVDVIYVIQLVNVLDLRRITQGTATICRAGFAV